MYPHHRNRTNRDGAEGVYVKPTDGAGQANPPGRRRVSKRPSAYASVLGGALFMICIIIYLITADDVVSGDTVQVKPNDKVDVLDPPPAATEELEVIVTDAPTQDGANGETTAVVDLTNVDEVTETTTTTTTTLVPVPASPQQYTNIFDPQDTRTARPDPIFVDIAEQYESGEFQPEEPQLLPGLTITRRTFTPDELLGMYADTDYIYSFVNGSEANHAYRKVTLGACVTKIVKTEKEVYLNGGKLPEEMQLELHNNTPACFSPHLLRDLNENSTGEDLWQTVTKNTRPGIGDRETDELRHSVRSLEQHVQWHRGRVLMVSPGHHPTWVDGAKNFLAGRCGGASVQALRLKGKHMRLTTVHQDAIMPYGITHTVDSHSIEQHLWRVRNVSATHVYMNDDYFVNRDVAITDLFNEYGGTIVRTEKGILKYGVRGPEDGGTWGEGVRNTHLFNIMELDLRHDDYLPEDLEDEWNAERERQSVAPMTPIGPIDLNSVIDVALKYVPAPWPKSVKTRRHRRYATHAPFVYCTNMHRFMQTRYARDFAYYSFIHRSRKGSDLYVPFVYNAFIMARPWVASPKFLPYLLELHRSRQQTPTAAPPSVEISLDNFDSCGQSTLRGGRTASECLYGKFLDNVTANTEMVERILAANPLYFNINSGFGTEAASNQLREFLHNKFPIPAYVEALPETTTADPGEAAEEAEEDKTTTNAAVHDTALTATFDKLMTLPVVGLVSYEEGACPLVRSLSLAFADHHHGQVHIAVQRHGDGATPDATLRELRTSLGHLVYGLIPSSKCAYNDKVVVGEAAREETVAAIAKRVVTDADVVELPLTCGGDDAGLRVHGFVIDARTPNAPVTSTAALREALVMPGQTLAVEDFRAVTIGPEDRDVVLVLAREDAAAKAVHWIRGASENDLLLTFPLPVAAYENLKAPLKWTQA